MNLIRKVATSAVHRVDLNLGLTSGFCVALWMHFLLN